MKHRLRMKRSFSQSIGVLSPVNPPGGSKNASDFERPVNRAKTNIKQEPFDLPVHSVGCACSTVAKFLTCPSKYKTFFPASPPLPSQNLSNANISISLCCLINVLNVFSFKSEMSASLPTLVSLHSHKA